MTVLALLIAAAVAAVAALGSWTLVRDDVSRWEGAGISATGAWRFVVGAAAAAGVLGFLVARRLLRGAPVKRRCWLLQVPAGARAPRPAELVERLHARGYRLELHAGEDGVVALRDARIGPRGTGVSLRMPAAGAGLIEVAERQGAGAAEELALFVIAELGDLVPGLVYKPIDSAGSADSATLLRAALPERPLALAPGTGDPPRD
jgi:hypothetical protein